MNQPRCKFYPFLQAAHGSWRNTIFIRCGCASCPFGLPDPCEGFLMAVNADGQLLLFPAEEIRRLTGEAIDPAECCARLERRAFETVFAQYIEWHTPGGPYCPLRQLCAEAGTCRYP